MLPVIFGITAIVGSALTASQSALIGAGVGAATAAGLSLATKDQNPRRLVDVSDEEEDEINEIVERLLRRRLKEKGKAD